MFMVDTSYTTAILSSLKIVHAMQLRAAAGRLIPELPSSILLGVVLCASTDCISRLIMILRVLGVVLRAST